MKKLIMALCLTLIPLFLLAYDVPKFTNYVNDYGGLLSEQEKNQLNQILKSYEDSTSNQIAVLTIPSYDDGKDGALFDFSITVFKSWKIGQKSKNNGVLLVVVKNLASKNTSGLRIVTGYGLEGALPDAICKRIIGNIRHSINEGRYYEGINTALNSMISQIKGEFNAEEQDDSNLIMWIVIIIIVILLIIIIAIASSSGGGGSSFIWIDSSSSGSSSNSGSGFDGGGGGDSGGGGAGD